LQEVQVMIEARMESFLDVCRWCEAQVVWATGPAGQRIPFDADPEQVSELGNWALSVVDKVRLVAAQPTIGQAAGMRMAGMRLYNHHALHCPQADRWHKVKDHGSATRRARGGRR
jgi:hypothetical protein